MNDPTSQSSSSTDITSQSHRGKFNFWRWFWLGTIPVSLVWVWFDFYVPANQITWAKNFASAQQQATQSRKPIIIFFTGKWCVPCRIMKRTVWADEQVEAVVNAGFTPVMIQTDDPNAAETVSRYHVVATPTTIIADSQGNILERAEGGMGKTVFLGWLGKVMPNGSSVPVPLAK
jgi:protein disulfide-isomerase